MAQTIVVDVTVPNGAATPSTVTPVAPVKLVPVIVIVVPPANGPEPFESDEYVGAAIHLA